MTRTQSSARFPALGGIAIVAVVDSAQLAGARIAVEQTVAAFDLACSRFREDSELSVLNGTAGGTSVAVSPLLLEAVTASLRAARLTDGDVDPTVGEALVALGYDRDLDRRSLQIAAVAGWRAITVDPDTRLIRLPRGVKLDLGATAKALAADRAAAAAHLRAGCGVLVSLSGDIAIAGSAPQDGWSAWVTDDHRSSVGEPGKREPGQWITLRSGGLATSSTTVRRWRAGGQTLHHLIDPGTGVPTRGRWRTVSVAAGSCLDANIASTAAIVRGERAAPWLESLGLPSRLVDVSGTVTHLAGWPATGDDLAPRAVGDRPGSTGMSGALA
ncbi:MAG: FAD:protein FMN transferase [Solirubrobacteraceae bacterium]